MKTKMFAFCLVSVLLAATVGFSQVASAAVAPQAKSVSKSTKKSASHLTVVDEFEKTERALAAFAFVINRGEVFAVNAPGELTSLSLSNFTTDRDPLDAGMVQGAMNEYDCRNEITLLGATTINEYSPEPSMKVSASLRVRPLTASRGLLLTLVVDGNTLQVPLPFASGDCRWKAGFNYRYMISVNAGSLQVVGMTVEKLLDE